MNIEIGHIKSPKSKQAFLCTRIQNLMGNILTNTKLFFQKVLMQTGKIFYWNKLLGKEMEYDGMELRWKFDFIKIENQETLTRMVPLKGQF